MGEVFLDSNVFLYATGGEHPHRDPCREILQAAEEGRFRGIVSVEVAQEVIHVHLRRTGDRGEAIRLGQLIHASFDTLPVEPEDIELALQILGQERRLTVRDSIHVATMRNHVITTIVTADRDFDDLDGIERVEPSEFSVD